MRLNSIHLLNFRQHVDTRIAFESGLTGIIGANGSGKSTILEAIAWALYGQDAARGKKETIRTLRAAPAARVRVELDFELGGHRHRVVRGLNSAELYLDDSETPIANSLSSVSDILRRRLGMSRDEFFNTYFTGQKELDVMAAMSAPERAQFLSRVLGYERLRVAQKLAKENGRLIAAEASGLRGALPELSTIERMVADAQLRLEQARERATTALSRKTLAAQVVRELEPQWAALQQEREQARATLSELRVADSEVNAFAREFERIERELADVAHADEELARLAEELAPLASLTEELEQLDQLAHQEARRVALLETEKSLEDEVRRLRERRERIETAPAREEEVTLELERMRAILELNEGELEAKRTEWVRDRQEAETKRAALRKQYTETKEARDRLTEAGEDGTCPVCERPLHDHYRSVLDHFDEQIDTLLADGNYYRSRIEQLEKIPPEVSELDERRRANADEVSRLERTLATIQAEVKELTTLLRDLHAREQRLSQLKAEREAIPSTYDGVRHAAARKELERLKPLDARATRLNTQLERRPKLEADQTATRAQLEQAQARVASLTAVRDKLAFSEERYEAMRVREEAAAAELRSSELESVAASTDATAALAALQRAEMQRDEHVRQREHLTSLDRTRRLHDELDRAFSDLRTDLNADLRPEIGDIASAFVKQLTDNRYDELQLDENYTLTLLEGAVPKPVISGGEQDIANLCLRLAISQMIAERAGQNFSLLVLDEVFGSLDESRRTNVVELLRGLQDRFEQVILITHIDAVREGLDRVISVRYDEETGSSIVTQSDPGSVEDLELEVAEVGD